MLCWYAEGRRYNRSRSERRRGPSFTFSTMCLRARLKANLMLAACRATCNMPQKSMKLTDTSSCTTLSHATAPCVGMRYLSSYIDATICFLHLAIAFLHVVSWVLKCVKDGGIRMSFLACSPLFPARGLHHIACDQLLETGTKHTYMLGKPY